MAEKPRPSRVPTSRPRKLAGQRQHAEPPADAGIPNEPEPPEVGEAQQPPPLEPPEAEPEWPDETPPPPSTRTTVILIAVITLLLAVAATEAWYLGFMGLRDETPPVSAERPVVVSPLTANSVVDTAAKAATQIISASYEDYDAHVDEVAQTMTDGFAEQFRATKEDIRDEFVASKTKVTADISEQGVVTASPEQVVALIFLTQNTQRPNEPLDVVQYKVTVTMVHTSSGWLVSNLKTL
jgi:Mce-associated membrane protein